MRITLFEKYYTNEDINHPQGWYILMIICKLFKIRWFTDCGEWFLYLVLGKRYWRFSSVGFTKGVE